MFEHLVLVLFHRRLCNFTLIETVFNVRIKYICVVQKVQSKLQELKKCDQMPYLLDLILINRLRGRKIPYACTNLVKLKIGK